MRLWSIHPQYLDRRALVACWREALLAQKVLAGGTKGYRNHPQLQRFKASGDPLVSIGAFLVGIQQEATTRGYRFDATRILYPEPQPPRISVNDAQLTFEMDHLRTKVLDRAPEEAYRLSPTGSSATNIVAHPLFEVVSGPVEEWERK